MTGDYSKYPQELQDILPYLDGETCELRSHIHVFRHLFMSSEKRTAAMGKRLDGLLGYLQQFFQDEMFVGVARLIDRDIGQQSNLSLWGLAERCIRCDAAFGADIKKDVGEIAKDAKNVRAHRNKRIAHYDEMVSVGSLRLPEVTFQELFDLVGKIESLMNKVSWRFTRATMAYEYLDHRPITTAAEITVLKAIAYDAAVEAGKIEGLAWREHIFEKRE